MGARETGSPAAEPSPARAQRSDGSGSLQLTPLKLGSALRGRDRRGWRGSRGGAKPNLQRVPADEVRDRKKIKIDYVT